MILFKNKAMYLKGGLLEEEMKMTKKYLRKWSTSLGVMEIQVKITLRFHIALLRMAKIKKTTDNKCFGTCRERRTLIHCS